MATRINAATKNGLRLSSAAIALIAAASSAQAQELLLNGNFEAGDIGFGAANWTVYNNGYTTGEYARTEGGKSFKAYAPYSQYAGSVGLQAPAAAAPGDTFTLTGYMFSPSNDFIASPGDFGDLELNFLDAANQTITGSAVSAHFTNADTADLWKPYTITATAPAGATKVNVVIGYIQLSAAGPLGAVYWDDLSLTKNVVAAESNWIGTSSGGWLTASNWQGGVVPNAVGAVANFGSTITAPSTVTIAGAGATAGTVRFNNATNAYTIGGTGNLTLDVASGSAALTVQAGSHSINAPLVLNDSTVASVVAGQTLTIGGSLNVGAAHQLSVTNGGTLRINATSVTGGAGSSVVANGGILQADVDLGTNLDVTATAGEARLNATQHIRSLSIAANAKATLPDTASLHLVRTSTLNLDANGTLDLGDNALVLDYTAASPAAAIRSAIITGRTGGGKGFTSTKTTNPSWAVGYAEASGIGLPATFLGETIDSTTLLVRVTRTGDSDLDGIVGFSDLVAIGQSYNGTGKVWSQGDFNYDGTVNFDDLVPLAANYGQTASLEDIGNTFGAGFASDWALAQSLAPEPTSIAALGMASFLLRRRRVSVG